MNWQHLQARLAIGLTLIAGLTLSTQGVGAATHQIPPNLTTLTNLANTVQQAQRREAGIQQLIVKAQQKQVLIEQEVRAEKLKLASTKKAIGQTLSILANVLANEYTTAPQGGFLVMIAGSNLQTALNTQIAMSTVSQSTDTEIEHLLRAQHREKVDQTRLLKLEIANQDLTMQLQAQEMVATIQVAKAQVQATAALKQILQAARASGVGRPTTASKTQPPTVKITPPPPSATTPAGANLPFTIDTNLTQPSGITLGQIKAFLANTPLEADSSDFLKAQTSYHVSAIYLVADAVLETGFGSSTIYLAKHNLFGFEAYTSNPNAAASFSSDAACISYVAWYVSVNYLTPPGSTVTPYGAGPGAHPSVPTGQFYNGPTLAGMNVDYATDPTWADKLAYLGEDLQLSLAQ